MTIPKKQIKYLLVALLMVVAGILTVLIFYVNNQNNNDQDPFIDQFSSCQEVAPSYIGLSEQDAVDKAEKENRFSRITRRDDVSFPVTEDYSPSRLNFEVVDGLITKASCG